MVWPCSSPIKARIIRGPIFGGFVEWALLSGSQFVVTLPAAAPILIAYSDLPNKHHTMAKCWANIVPASQSWNNLSPTLSKCFLLPETNHVIEGTWSSKPDQLADV